MPSVVPQGPCLVPGIALRTWGASCTRQLGRAPPAVSSPTTPAAQQPGVNSHPPTVACSQRCSSITGHRILFQLLTLKRLQNSGQDARLTPGARSFIQGCHMGGTGPTTPTHYLGPPRERSSRKLNLGEELGPSPGTPIRGGGVPRATSTTSRIVRYSKTREPLRQNRNNKKNK